MDAEQARTLRFQVPAFNSLGARWRLVLTAIDAQQTAVVVPLARRHFD